MRIKVKQNVAGRGKVFCADTSENVNKDVVVILFDENGNFFQRP